MVRNTFAIIFIGLLLAFPAVSTAQQEQVEPDQALLPDIDPQDIEIRSQFQARFPGLRRQPILGFNPRSRVFQLDPDRTPFIEDEALAVGSLPIGALDRPEPPVYEKLGYASPQNGFARIGAGSYITPEADLYGILQLGNKNWISGNLNFESSDGHLDDFSSSYRNAEATVRTFSKIRDNTNLRTNLSVQSDFNHMLPLVTENEDFADVVSRVEQTGIDGGFSLDIARTALTGIKIDAGGYGNKFDVRSDLATFEGALQEWGAHVAGEYSRLGKNVQEVHKVRAESEFGGINPLDRNQSYWSVSKISARYERLFNYKTDIQASFGVSGVTDATGDFVVYLSPDLEVSHTIRDGFKIRGRAFAEPGHRSVQSIQEENRFLDLTSQFEHQFTKTALGEIELEPFSGMRIHGGVSYSEISNYLYFSRNAEPAGIAGIDAGYFQTNYSDANIFKVYGGISQELRADIIWVSADGYWQDPQLDDNRTIPYVENVGVKGTVSFRPTRQVLIEGWGEFIGSREFVGEDNLSAYFLMGGKFEISLTERAGVYGKLLNLLDDEYELWRGYPERGFQGFVGFTYLF